MLFLASQKYFCEHMLNVVIAAAAGERSVASRSQEHRELAHQNLPVTLRPALAPHPVKHGRERAADVEPLHCILVQITVRLNETESGCQGKRFLISWAISASEVNLNVSVAATAANSNVHYGNNESVLALHEPDYHPPQPPGPLPKPLAVKTEKAPIPGAWQRHGQVLAGDYWVPSKGPHRV